MDFCRLKSDLISQRRNRMLSLIIMVAFIAISPVFASETDDIKDIDITLAVDRQLQIDEGLPAHQVDVQTRDGIVTLSGSVENLLASESYYGSFQRSIRLPAEVKGDEVEANFKNGVLDIRPPRFEKTQSKKIKIKIGIRPPLSDDPNASVPILPNIGSRR
jgi:HSP20 family molecular chaperone IbpA